jgi:hypothetical protein
MNKARLLVSVLLTSLLLWGVFVDNSFGAGSWVDLIYDEEVSPQTRGNFQRAVDTSNDLLAKYKIVLSNPVTVVLTSNDPENYIRAIMSYGGASRSVAEAKAKTGVIWGLSSTKKPAIIIRNVPTRQLTPQGTSVVVNNPEEGFRTVPHELFHQIQNQYTSVRTVNWLQEGPPELFKFLALEAAGIRSVKDSVQMAEKSISMKGVKIPDTKQLASYDYNAWESLGLQRYPVYHMAALMMYRLAGDKGFEEVIYFYQLLRDGNNPDKAFVSAFGVQMSQFLDDMNDYFNGLAAKQKMSEK